MENNNLIRQEREIKYQKKILEEMIKDLNVSCKRETDYAGLGEDLLSLYQKLINYYQDKNDLVILQDLKTKLEGIRKWKTIDYNKEIASSICQYLKKQVQFKEQVTRKQEFR